MASSSSGSNKKQGAASSFDSAFWTWNTGSSSWHSKNCPLLHPPEATTSEAVKDRQQVMDTGDQMNVEAAAQGNEGDGHESKGNKDEIFVFKTTDGNKSSSSSTKKKPKKKNEKKKSDKKQTGIKISEPTTMVGNDDAKNVPKEDISNKDMESEQTVGKTEKINTEATSARIRLVVDPELGKDEGRPKLIIRIPCKNKGKVGESSTDNNKEADEKMAAEPTSKNNEGIVIEKHSQDTEAKKDYYPAVLRNPELRTKFKHDRPENMKLISDPNPNNADTSIRNKNEAGPKNKENSMLPKAASKSTNKKKNEAAQEKKKKEERRIKAVAKDGNLLRGMEQKTSNDKINLTTDDTLSDDHDVANVLLSLSEGDPKDDDESNVMSDADNYKGKEKMIGGGSKKTNKKNNKNKNTKKNNKKKITDLPPPQSTRDEIPRINLNISLTDEEIKEDLMKLFDTLPPVRRPERKPREVRDMMSLLEVLFPGEDLKGITVDRYKVNEGPLRRRRRNR